MVPSIGVFHEINKLPTIKRIQTITDSRSLIDCTRKNTNAIPLKTRSKPISSMIQSEDNQHKITIFWVPSHCGVASNEWADDAANAGFNLTQESNNFIIEPA